MPGPSCCNRIECTNGGEPSQKLLLCTGCKCVYYCSQECAKKTWKKHKGECIELKRVIALAGTPTEAELKTGYNRAKKQSKPYIDQGFHLTCVDLQRGDHLVKTLRPFALYLYELSSTKFNTEDLASFGELRRITGCLLLLTNELSKKNAETVHSLLLCGLYDRAIHEAHRFIREEGLAEAMRDPCSFYGERSTKTASAAEKSAAAPVLSAESTTTSSSSSSSSSSSTSSPSRTPAPAPAPRKTKVLRETRETQQFLFDACRAGSIPDIRLCLEMGADINYGLPKMAGLFPLWAAAWQGHKEACAFLLSKGANVNQQSTDGTMCTALTVACQDVRADCVELLLEAGADANHRRDRGETPLILSAGGGHMVTCQIEAFRCVRALVKAGASVNAKDLGGVDALMRASDDGNTDAVELLLNEGADQIDSAIASARHKGRTSMVELLTAVKEVLAAAQSPPPPPPTSIASVAAGGAAKPEPTIEEID